MLVTSHFRQTPGIEAAPVVDRKNARLCLVDKLSGFTMPISKLSWNIAPARLRSTKKPNSLESPKQSLSSDWRRRVPQRERRHLTAHGLLRRPLSMILTGVGFEPLPCPLVKGDFSIPVDFLRACVPDDFTPLDFSGPCAYVPFLSWPNLAPGLDGCFRQDHIRCHDNVCNSPDILRSTRRWKADILRTSNLPAQEAASLTGRFGFCCVESD